MKNTPELQTTYVREDKAYGGYEYGWLQHEGIGRDHFMRVGRCKSREIAHDLARQLMRFKIAV